MRGDYYHEITDELARHGITPEVGLTKGNHVRFRWKVNNHNQTLVTGGTPSDNRAGKNALARVKRLLRDAGIDTTTVASPARAAVAPLKLTVEQRINRLEHDMQTITMLMETIVGKIDAAIAGMLTEPHAPPPEPAPEPSPKPVVVKPVRRDARGRPPLNPDFLWRVMRYDEFLAVTAIAKACSKRVAYTSNLLTKLKARGLVQHKPGVGWRKDRKVEQLNGHRTAQ